MTSSGKRQADILSFFQVKGVKLESDCLKVDVKHSMEDEKIASLPDFRYHDSSETSDRFCPSNLPSRSFIDDRDINDEIGSSQERYAWLLNPRDCNGNSPNDPDYDPQTLFIPKTAWANFTPFERQFWEIKCKMYDTVVFFKKGKFYELYENDADIGCREFDLKMTDRVNMRMAGVPEATFDLWATRFVKAGYRVARVDQVETAVGKTLRERDDKTADKSDKLIRRELTEIFSAGTILDPKMISSDHPNYLACIASEGSTFAILFADLAAGRIYFSSKVNFHSLQSIVARMQPIEILADHHSKAVIEKIRPLLSGFSTTIQEVGNLLDKEEIKLYFLGTKNSVAVTSLLKDSLTHILLHLFVKYIEHLKLKSVLSACQFFQLSTEEFEILQIDGKTLGYLEVIPSRFTAKGQSLLEIIDYCITPCGKRLLREWICSPLKSAASIRSRQNMVSTLMENSEYSSFFSTTLKGISDIERSLLRINCQKIKIMDLCKFFTDLGNIISVLDFTAGFPSLLEMNIITPDILRLQKLHQFAKSSVDWELSLQKYLLVPCKGINAEYDEICLKINEIKNELEDHRYNQEKTLNIKGIKFKDVGRDVFQLELPADAAVPNSYILLSKTKACKRYWTPFIKKCVVDLQEWQERQLSSMRNFYFSFIESVAKWAEDLRGTIEVISTLDCLISLSVASLKMEEPKCLPLIVEDSEDSILSYKDLRHPCVRSWEERCFIPNDLNFDKCKRSLVLTGPNMGGKSTLLRQTCLAVIMAQVGCFVPAQSFEITPVDKIFTRIGSHDDLTAGQSTFMIELLEASTILKNCTSRSLVVLDELGRGTSTFDGMAIAQAVLEYLVSRQKCICMFATHYRPLALYFENYPSVSCMFMSFEAHPDQKRITFLYKLKEGISPRSFGINVAIAAGLPSSVISEAQTACNRFDAVDGSHTARDLKATFDLKLIHLLN